MRILYHVLSAHVAKEPISGPGDVGAGYVYLLSASIFSPFRDASSLQEPTRRVKH